MARWQRRKRDRRAVVILLSDDFHFDDEADGQEDVDSDVVEADDEGVDAVGKLVHAAAEGAVARAQGIVIREASGAGCTHFGQSTPRNVGGVYAPREPIGP